jgi:hypothetical protein
MADEDKLYMIQRRSDGLYSSGGAYPQFSKAGKIWKTMSTLNLHLTSVYKGWRANGCLKAGDDGKYSKFDIAAFADMVKNPYINCDIVEVELTPTTAKDVFTHIALRYLKEESKDKV